MAPEAHEFVSRSAAETRAFGARLARILPSGSVLALSGELGAGKTCFVAGLAVGLGIEEPVTSPTYTLMHEYRSEDQNRVLIHFDAWMAGRERGFLEGGGAEWLVTEGVAAVEWADHVQEYLPDPHVAVLLEHAGPEDRRIRLRVVGSGSGPPAAGDLEAAVARAVESAPGEIRNSPDGPNRGDPGALG